MFNYVTAYLSLIILIVAFNTKFLNAQSVQVSNKSITRQFTWVYDLPRSYPRGPLDVTVKGEYYYTKERLGDRYFVRLHCRMISLEFNAVHGTLRYKYNGKEYRQDQLDATDQKGSYGFDQIRIIKIAANIDVSFLENSKTVSIGDGIAKEVGDIDKDADLNKLNLELAGSRLTNLNWDGSIDLEQRILNLSKPKVTTPNYNSNNSNTYNSSNNSNNSTGNNSSNKSSSTNGTTSGSLPIESTNSNKSTNNFSSSNSTSSNSSSTNSNNNTSSNTSSTYSNQGDPTYTIPSAESQMRQLGIDPDKDYLGELITMGGTLLQEMNENRRLRWEKEAKEAERLEKLKAENTANNHTKYINYFKNNFVDKYFSAAKAGDEAARLILIMKCSELESECSAQPNSDYCDYENFLKVIPQDSIPKDAIPQDRLSFSHWYWFSHWESEMIKNNNIDVLNMHGRFLTKQNLEYSLPLLEIAIDKGSLDAMVILGMYYNKKDYNKGDAIDAMDGGMDEEKALYWFTKAANAGCPMAAYYLGMIYRYGHTLRPINYSKNISDCIAYSVKKDDKVAADWFAKSIINSKNHKESSFAKHRLICDRNLWSKSSSSMEDSYYGLEASITNPDAFLQLSKMYLKGEGVVKNETFAKQLQQEGNVLFDFYKDLK